jgi:hypothetical protein
MPMPRPPAPLRPFQLTLVLAALLAAPAQAAHAAEVSARVEPAGGVRYGTETTVAGSLTEAGVPLPGQPVILEARRFPYRGPWTALDTVVTLADGSFAFARELDRNHDIRVRHESSRALSRAVTAFVFPSFTLEFTELRTGRIRITQTYSVPRDVRLSAPTRFYVGSQSARRARLRATTPTRRTRPGRYRSVARVEIPDSYGGRFRYVSCFRYSPGSGMGDPARPCPRRLFPLR